MAGTGAWRCRLRLVHTHQVVCTIIDVCLCLIGWCVRVRGPAFAPSGLYRDVRLVSFNGAYLTDFTFSTTFPSTMSWRDTSAAEGLGLLERVPLNTPVTVNTTVYLRFETAAAQPVTKDGCNSAAAAPVVVQGTLNASVAGTSTSVSVSSASGGQWFDGVTSYSLVWQVTSGPALWWPVGYGAAALYPLTVQWTGSSTGVAADADPTRHVMSGAVEEAEEVMSAVRDGEQRSGSDSATRSVGFRWVEVVRETMPVQQGM
jgi:hypothetical protein